MINDQLFSRSLIYKIGGIQHIWVYDRLWNAAQPCGQLLALKNCKLSCVQLSYSAKWNSSESSPLERAFTMAVGFPRGLFDAFECKTPEVRYVRSQHIS
ncbi:hypothetical protein Y032_0043g878 [Ancylostoma ceylanicum]|nr:hypothetical protein Y032_0043g878 [Ancylostoma ceylanicum]